MQNIKMFSDFIKELSEKKNVIYELTQRDFKANYLGSYLGMIWAFLLPIANIFIFWFVFQIGFRSKPVQDFPYILWYIVGMIIWNFFSDSVNNGMNSVAQNAFVVKKVAFSIGILPIIKILSALAIHAFFLVFVGILFVCYGYYPDLYWLQVFYYLLATLVLVTGLSWLTASVVIFFRDLRQIIAILLQFGFFLTPIFWSVTILPPKYQAVIKFNPIFYLVNGYRDSFIHKVWFWENMASALFFWSFTIATFILGALVFRRLRPHFADVI
ncbi:ABC transporter permease [Geomonas subterranea]|uniref:Transport permease protein n=3 Tax=Geomonas subterranea TaxID=2847989 RepID=A0ABX8LL17_9BACT|nr:ABC transporter permease [Geomonas subterranea]QXE90923.1 ABC transporter permease [Geomonas subterranea]QXM10991.1 ABC transporter permease [Geomonas subterranea]